MAGGELPPGGGDPERFELAAFVDLSPELAHSRLPAGRHGLPRSFVALNQRLRIVAAMLEVLPDHGYSDVTIGHLTQAAGVSRAAFYEQFESKEECLLATYDLVGDWFRERLERTIAAGRDWPSQVRAAVLTGLNLLAANPSMARLIAVDVLQAGPVARQRQQARLSELAEALRAGRPGGEGLATELEELLLGGAVSMVGRYVDGGRIQRLPEAAPELVSFLLTPFLGGAESLRIAAEAA